MKVLRYIFKGSAFGSIKIEKTLIHLIFIERKAEFASM